MADISGRITRKSLKAKKKAAIKTIKAQAKEKIREVKLEYAQNPERNRAKLREKELKKQERIERSNARIAYNERLPYQFTLGEDIFNSIISGFGAGLSAAAIVLLVLRAVQFAQGSGRSLPVTIVSFVLFGSFMFVHYMMSTLHHSIKHPGARKVFKVLNWVSIYLLIGGSYTVYLLTMSPRSPQWAAFIVVWSICALLALWFASIPAKLDSFAEFTFVVMSWVLAILVFVMPASNRSMGMFVKAMFGAAVASYTVGEVFMHLKNYKWMHTIFHIFVLAGSVFQFFGLYFCIG